MIRPAPLSHDAEGPTVRALDRRAQGSLLGGDLRPVLDWTRP